MGRAPRLLQFFLLLRFLSKSALNIFYLILSFSGLYINLCVMILYQTHSKLGQSGAEILTGLWFKCVGRWWWTFQQQGDSEVSRFKVRELIWCNHVYFIMIIYIILLLLPHFFLNLNTAHTNVTGMCCLKSTWAKFSPWTIFTAAHNVGQNQWNAFCITKSFTFNNLALIFPISEFCWTQHHKVHAAPVQTDTVTRGVVMTGAELGWQINSECCFFNPEWTSKYFMKHVGWKTNCLITVFHDTVSFINMSVIIKSHRTQVKAPSHLEW